MTILDCCISLKMIKKNLVVLGVVDMRQLMLNVFLQINLFKKHLTEAGTYPQVLTQPNFF